MNGMGPIVGLGWDRPLGGAGSGGWDWWALAGAVALFLLVQTAHRRPHVAVSIVLAAAGGLALGDLTQMWGVVPVWGSLALIALSRNAYRRRSRPQV